MAMQSMTEITFFIMTHISSLLVTIMLHEFGHTAASKFLDGQPVMYHVYVRHGSLTPHHRAIVAAAGPMISLAQGIICLVMFMLVGDSVWGLIVIWLSLLGLANFFGYLITTPFWSKGDLGKIAKLLKWSWFWKMVVAVVGLLAMLALTKIAALLFNSIDGHFDITGRAAIYWTMIMLPWLLGCVVSALMSYPTPVSNVLIYPFFSGFYLVPVFWLLNPNQDTVQRYSELGFSELVIILSVMALTGSLFRHLRNGWPMTGQSQKRSD